MPQFFVSPDAIQKDVIEIRGKEARHLQDVLRLEVGDWVVVCDGEGHRYRAVLVASRPLNVQLRRGNALPEIHLPCHVTLAAAVIRPQRFDWLVEKVFELGCRRLIPLITERTVATYIKNSLAGERVLSREIRTRPAPSVPSFRGMKDARKQHARWTEIALSAAKQSGLPWLPEISPLTALADVIQNPSGQLIYCWEGLASPLLCKEGPGEAGSLPHPTSPYKKLARRRASFIPSNQNKTDPKGPSFAWDKGEEITLLIGPEGGFSPAEHERIMNTAPTPLPLGPLILRSETAAIVAMTKVMQ